MKPDVSIIIPSYQQAQFLRAAVESVLQQTGVSAELLVLDGGSTDGSVEILESYRERFWWRSGRDAGQASAINEGLRRARGEVVGFLNSDDFLMPGALAAAVGALATHCDAHVVYGRGMIVDEYGMRMRDAPVLPFERGVFVEHCFICQPAAFWRRSLHDRFGFFSSAFDHTLDYEFWLRLMEGGARFLHVPEFWACSRDHPSTKTNRLRREIFRQIREAQIKHLGYCGRNWWEQQLRYWRDESCSPWARFLPGKRDERLYRLAWWPYILWRRKPGGPLFYKSGHWRA